MNKVIFILKIEIISNLKAHLNFILEIKGALKFGIHFASE